MDPRTPIGSRPGTSRRASAPAMSPTIIQMMISMSFLLSVSPVPTRSEFAQTSRPWCPRLGPASVGIAGAMAQLPSPRGPITESLFGELEMGCHELAAYGGSLEEDALSSDDLH